MKIEHVRVLWGPNYWSIKHQQLIVVLLNLEELEEYPTNKIPQFYERITNLIPSLYNHECSEGMQGGFFARVKDGTWMGHVIEHIALEIQTLAGMDVGFGRTRGTGSLGCYHVVFSYEVAEAGKFAAKAAVRIADALVRGESYDLEKDIMQMKDIAERLKLGPTTASIVAEAKSRGIPSTRLDDEAYVQLGYGSKHKKIEASITSQTSIIGVELAGDKHRTKQILTDVFVPVPQGIIITGVEKIESAVSEVGFPVVIKPLDGNQGKGATTNIRTLPCAIDAFKRAKEFSEKIIVEQFIEGKDFRALVVNFKFVAAALRTPAAVIGDGKHTIHQLIDLVNEDPRRGNGHCNVLTKIKVDDATKEILAKHKYSLQTVLPEGEEFWLKTTANLSTGGTSENITAQVHPCNASLFERIARTMGLDICGIDVMAPDLAVPITQNGGAVIEVNAAPGLRMHLEPTTGEPLNVAAPIVDMLFPQNANGRIPIIAITGTNGKTTTSRILSHMVQNAGFNTGYTNTDGIYINKELIFKGDCSGPYSAQVLLRDPKVEFAVLECARGGILRSGLGFDECDCAIVTNVAEDHLGLDGIDTVEKLAKVKSVVPETVKKDGYAILNADDDLVYAMKDRVKCKVGLFSLHIDNVRIQQHCEQGGIAAISDEGYLLIREGNKLTVIDEVQNVPITYAGKAKFNVANVLAAALAAYVSNINLDGIRKTLRSFSSSAEEIPGRMNEFRFDGFTVMVDYAHNPHGLRAFGEFITSVPATKKIGVIAGVGDRRNEDIMALAEEAARIFDEIVIRMDEDLRGRTESEIYSLLRNGIHKVDPGKKVNYFSTEADAVDNVVHHAEQGSLTVIFADKVDLVCNKLKEYRDQFAHANHSMKQTA